MPAKLDSQSYFWNAGDEVLIRNSDLPDSLFRNPVKSIAQLSAAVSPITLDKIKIDETGNVIITDATFKSTIVTALTGPGGLSANAGCGNITCASV